MLSFRWYAKQLKKSHKATRYYEITTAGHNITTAHDRDLRREIRSYS